MDEFWILIEMKYRKPITYQKHKISLRDHNRKEPVPSRKVEREEKQLIRPNSQYIKNHRSPASLLMDRESGM